MSGAQLKVNGKLYGGWLTVNATRSIDCLAGTFDLSVTEIWPQQQKPRSINPGDACTLLLNGQVVITGYVDDVNPSHDARTRSLQVCGRDATADLVDCSVQQSGFNAQKMDQLAAALCAPYKIKVTVSGVDVGAAFNSWNASVGESVAENLDRMSKHRGVLVMSDGHGGLLLTAPSKTRAPTDLVLGSNILSASGRRSHRDRYRHYKVAGQLPNTDDNTPDQATSSMGSAEDKGVGRDRTLWVMAEETAELDTLNKRAIWERNVRAGRALETTVAVQGWEHAKGLWQPNTLVHLKDSLMHIDQVLLIAGVTYILDAQGTRCELRLLPPSAFEILAEPEGYLS